MSRRSKADRKRARANQAMFDSAIAISCPRREPNGRLSRRAVEVRTRTEMTEQEAKRPMIEARARQHPTVPPAELDIVDAGRPNLGTVHGMMQLQGRLTMDQFLAAEWYIEKRNLWARAVEMPGEPDDKLKRGDFNEAGHVAFCKAAKLQWSEIIDTIQQASVDSRSPILSALDHILIRQQDLEHMVGDLRLGLNALRRRFM